MKRRRGERLHFLHFVTNKKREKWREENWKEELLFSLNKTNPYNIRNILNWMKTHQHLYYYSVILSLLLIIIACWIFYNVYYIYFLISHNKKSVLVFFHGIVYNILRDVNQSLNFWLNWFFDMILETDITKCHWFKSRSSLITKWNI